MKNLIELKLRLNKKNGQINMSLPKKKFNYDISKFKKAFVKFEDFE